MAGPVSARRPWHHGAVPTGAGHWLCALDSYLADSKEAVVVTDGEPQSAVPMLRRLASVFEPSAVRVAMSSDSDRFGRLAGFRRQDDPRRSTNCVRMPELRLPTSHKRRRNDDGGVRAVGPL